MLNFITQQRRGTTEEWANSTVVPRAGEIVLEECSDGITKIKIGNGRNTFNDLPYPSDEITNQLTTLEVATETLSEQLAAHVAYVNGSGEDLPENSIETEIIDARIVDGVEHKTVGKAIRSVNDAVKQLEGFIDSAAVDGLYYENDMLYLTANNQILEETGVKILQGSGGGGGSSSSLKITYSYPSSNSWTLSPDDDATIKFIFEGTDSSGDKIDEVDATWKIDNTVVAYSTVKYGENSFDLAPYLKVGSQKVVLTVQDAIGNKAAKAWTIQLVDFRIDSKFDETVYYDDKAIIFTYIPYGAVEKTVHFILDDVELPEVVTSVSGTELRYTLPELTHGSHLLKVYMTATVNDNYIETDPLLKDLLWNDHISSAPLIGCSAQQINTEQYNPISIRYTVFDPEDETPEISIYIDDNTTPVKTQEVSQPTNQYEWTFTDIGAHTITIACKETKKVIAVEVTKLDFELNPVTEGLMFDFNPVGKSNSDIDRLWTDGKTSMTVSDNFDWINGGYQQDDNGDTYFCVKSGSKATINYALFGDSAALGKEVKVIFRTTNVSNAETPVVSCVDSTTGKDSIGLVMTPYTANVYGKDGSLELTYSEEDIIEFEFNITAQNATVPMIMGYEDGVSTRPLVYSTSYSFEQNTKKPITIGSDDCDVHIYRFKAYYTALSDQEILNNFIADARNTEEMRNRFKRNNIYKGTVGQLTPMDVANACPDLRVYIISAPHFTNDKDNQVVGTRIQQIYKGGDPILDNWTCYNCMHSGQGTSSNEYGAAGRNLDFIMNDSGDDKTEPYFLLGDGTTVTDKITLSRTSIPVAYLNAKVNIASSNNLTNAILAKRYNQFNPYRRPFIRNDGTDVSFIKDTMEFYNCVIFIEETDANMDTHREFKDNDVHFYAIGNIGDSKKTDNTRATDPDDRFECCVEILDVGLPLSDFPLGTKLKAPGIIKNKKGEVLVDLEVRDDNLNILLEGTFNKTTDTKITYGKEYYIYDNATNAYKPVAYIEPGKFENIYEGTFVKTSDTTVDPSKTYYVDVLEQDNFKEGLTYGWRYSKNKKDATITTPCMEAWRNFYRFVTTASDEEFKNNLQNYFVVNSALYYYLFTTRYCMVDNRAKNTFWHYSKTLDGTHKWDLCWDYDNDTSLGLNNYGAQVYRYGLEDTDKDDSGIEVFRESDSIFFCRIRDCFEAELATMYQDLEDKNAWSASNFIEECDRWQNQFPEELWRQDIQRKYIRTYTESGINGPGDSKFLVDMCNGRMKYHRRQWERNQELYMATKYKTTKVSDTASSAAYFRFTNPLSYPEGLSPDYTLSLTPYSYGYLNVSYGGDEVLSQRVKSIGTPQDIKIPGTPDQVNVYNATMISDFGDLSRCYPKVVTVGHADRITSLVLGNETSGYEGNRELTSLTLDNNPLLENLDITNCVGFTSNLDLTSLINLQELHAYGTNITSASFAQNGKVDYVELPNVNTLEFKNLMYLETENINVSSYDNVTDLIVENCANIDALELFSRCSNLKSLRLINVDFGAMTYDEFKQMLSRTDTEGNVYEVGGLDQSGNKTAYAWLVGSIHLNGEVSGTQYQELKRRYPYLTISYDLLTCSVTFKSTDLVTTLYTQTVYNEANCEDPVNLGLISMPTKDQTVSTVYTWSGWSKLTDGQTVEVSPLLKVDDDIILYPTFDEDVRKYEVRFFNNTGALLNTYLVDYGTQEFMYPDVTPVKEGVANPENYEFKSWKPEPKNIVGSLDCYAVYELKEDAIYDVQLEDISYTLDTTQLLLTITKYNNNSQKTIRIPESYTIEGVDYTVDAIIGRDSLNQQVTGFSECDLEYVILPETLTNIGAYAFYNNKNITTITIPEGVIQLGPAAFGECNGLLEVYYNAINAKVVRSDTRDPYVFNNTASTLGYSLYVGRNVTKIPSYVFTQITSSIDTLYSVKDIEFEENSCCEIIESYAFSNTHVTSVTLPESLVEIKSSAFELSELEELILPSHVKTIGINAFANCSKLRHVYIPASLVTMSSEAFKYTLNTEFEIENGSIFVWKNHCMINTQTKTVLFGREDSIIPDDMGLTTIASYCFNEVNIVSLVIPSGITTISEHAFHNCAQLTHIEFPITLTKIENFGLYGVACYELVLPMNLQFIGLYSLVDNPNLTTITIPANVRTIGYQFLRGCTALTSVMFKTSELVINKPSEAFCELFTGTPELSYIEVNWKSDGSVEDSIRDVSYPFANINKDAPWKARTNSNGVQIAPVTVRYIDKTLVYNIDGTIEDITNDQGD